jgi:hypothetical protein
MPKRSLEELINNVDPAWPLVQEEIRKARNHVEVLPADRKQGEAVLLHLQVSTRSPMGALALESGGLFIDHGWLRFLGSGCDRMRGNLYTWNTEGEILKDNVLKDALVIAHDAVGGFFALNGGAFPGKLGTAFYFSPDSLHWENTEKSYSDLLWWALSGDLNLFYKTMRWPGWEKDVSALSGDQGMSMYPFPFLDRNIPIAQRFRRPIPMYELWSLYLDLSQQLGNLPPGTPIQFIIEKDSQDKEQEK